MMLGSPAIVGAVPGLAKSPGFFATTVRLDNPTVDALRQSILRLRAWLDANQHDPEFTSFQLNFALSGHDAAGAADGGALMLADSEMEAADLAALLLTATPEEEVSPSGCRLGLFLDCCHSGAVSRGLTLALAAQQVAGNGRPRSRLVPGQICCACLDDEEAFELDLVRHTVLTFAFLNECSRRRPEGARLTGANVTSPRPSTRTRTASGTAGSPAGPPPRSSSASQPSSSRSSISPDWSFTAPSPPSDVTRSRSSIPGRA